MIPSQREAVVLELLQQRGAISVDEIAVHCDCSPMTVRRDLHRMEGKRLIVRTHGGATLAKPSPSGHQFGGNGVLQARNAMLDRSDALIITPVSPGIAVLVERARRSGIPIIAESMNYQGAATYVAIDDYGAGVELGRWAGSYVPARKAGAVKVLDISSPLPNCTLRSRGFADGLRSTLGSRCSIVRVEGKEVRQAARDVLLNALSLHPDVDIALGINDDMVLAALDAFRAAGIDTSRLLLLSFGLEGSASIELMRQNGPYKAAIAMFPELVGRACIDAAVCAYHGCGLPDRITMPYALVTNDNIEDYYEKNSPGTWSLRPGVIERLTAGSPTLTMLDACGKRSRPKSIGFVEVLSSHAWYRNVQRAMADRTRAQDIRLEVIDASQDLERDIDRLLYQIGRAAAALVVDSDTIILDAGKATQYLASALCGRTGITVISNSLAVLECLADEAGIRLIATGGIVRGANRALVGHSAESTFGEIRASKAFLTCTGLSIDFGLSTVSTSELGVKQAMLRAAREVCVLADHTRIGTESLVKVGPIESVHRVITDAGISEHDRLALTQRGIDVTIAEPYAAETAAVRKPGSGTDTGRGGVFAPK